jgi:hypothetical protein
MTRNGTGSLLGAAAFVRAAIVPVALTCLVACGTAAPPVFHPAGEAAAPGQGESAQPAAARFPFPADVHFEFDSPPPTDPDQAAAVIADEDFQLAYYYGIYSQGRDQHYRFYIADPKVLASVQETLASEAAAHEGFTGTIRFYDTSVQPAPWAGEQTAANCVDSSRLLDTDIRTGRVLPARPGAAGRSLFLESDILAKRGGYWRVVGTDVTYYPDGQAKECNS